MRIAHVHKYLSRSGGAAVACLETARIQAQRGHRVCLLGMGPPDQAVRHLPCYTVSMLDLRAETGALGAARAAGRLLYSAEAKAQMRRLIREQRPDIVHFHSVYHHLSPSVIDAAAEAGLPMVKHMHSYKATCPVYSHRRDGRTCEACRGRRFSNCFRYRCTDGSALRSLLNTVEMYLHHQVLGVYGQVDTFIAPSRFVRDKVRELGFCGHIVHLPNFVDAGRFTPRYDWDARRIVYFGRLSPEKGLVTLLKAMRGLELELLVLGTGPQEDELKAMASRGGLDNVRFGGFRTGEALARAVGGAMFAVLPSEWHEPFGLSVLESFAMGKPAVGADIGGIPELIAPERGLLFRPGDAEDLRRRITELAADPAAIRQMGRAARRHVERNLSADVYYDGLMEVYARCLER